VIDQRSYLKAAREYLRHQKEAGQVVEQLLAFWEGLGGMWQRIANQLRRDDSD
jgi:hypothetical protein